MTKDLRGYANAETTPTMEAFADFLIGAVYGGSLPEGIEEASFRKGVALGGSTRAYFQKSDEWKSDARNYLANVESNRARKLAEATERAKATAAKAKAREEALIAKLAEAVEAAKAKAAKLAEVATEDSDAPETDAPESDAPESDAPESAPNPANVARRSRKRAA